MRGDLSIFRWNLVFLSLPVCLCLIAVPARAVDLPENAPIPKVRDEGAAAKAKKEEQKQEEKEELPQKAPIPKERPEEKPADTTPAADGESKPESAQRSGSEEDAPAEHTQPAPEAEAEKPAPSAEQAKPETEEEPAQSGEDVKSAPGKAEKPGPTEDQAEPTEQEEPAEPGEDDDRTTEPSKEPDIPPPLSPAGQRCRGNLRSLGVVFTEDDPVDSDEGCAIPHPLSIATLSKDITIEPAAELNCMMAETFAAFMQDVVQPAAERHFDQKVKAIRHASAFVCRPRNGTKILSEHAFGNALDIAAFILEDGSEVAVKAYDPEDHASIDKAQFLNEVRAAACGPFTTVLGPGSNADHASHFHFDLKERDNRYKVCE